MYEGALEGKRQPDSGGGRRRLLRKEEMGPSCHGAPQTRICYLGDQEGVSKSLWQVLQIRV